MVRFVSVCQSQIYKNYCNPITQSSENRFLRILEFVIEVKNRNNERIWVHPSDMGIVGVVIFTLNMNIQKNLESAHAILRKSDFGEFYSS